MISPSFLEMLRCPESGTRLTLADAAQISQLNAAISAGKLQNRAGQELKKPLTGGLLREDQTVLYPIVDDIPILLVDEGIELGSLS
ncbi:MAG: Trm112 family protein [Planctomycetota bacterium]|nr:Trm112 family protein [Planctomycetota bacterium]